jgi:hypothetical protein
LEVYYNRLHTSLLSLGEPFFLNHYVITSADTGLMNNRGSWFLSSLMFNDFPKIQDLVMGPVGGAGGWNLDIDLFAPGRSQVENLAFIASVLVDLGNSITHRYSILLLRSQLTLLSPRSCETIRWIPCNS